MSSVILLSSSSFFLSDYLTAKLLRNDYQAQQFSFALEQDNIAALVIQQGNYERGTQPWLSANKKLGNYQSDAALKLGLWYKQQAIIEPTVNSSADYQATTWLIQAIDLGSNQARLSLAKLYYHRKQFNLSQEVIAKYPSKILDKTITPLNSLEQDPMLVEVLQLKLKLAIYFGDTELIQQLFKLAKLASNNQRLGLLLADMHHYGIVKSSTLTKDKQTKNDSNGSTSIEKILADKIESTLPASCISSLQLFATNYEHLKHIDKLQESFREKYKHSIAPLICLAKPLYVSKNILQCKEDKGQPISCKESQWQKLSQRVTTKHVGLMLEQGGANVHLGILYFDVNDDVNVFTHELSHLLGFVDEYPLPKNHDACQQAQVKPFSHNIAVLKKVYQGNRKQLRANILEEIPWGDDIKETTPILTAFQSKDQQSYWRLGTPKTDEKILGVYLSETCQAANIPKIGTAKDKQVNYAAFKPLVQRTLLRSSGSDFPKAYSLMLTKRPNAYLMPSYHYNIALAFYQQGQIGKAELWLEKSSKWEVDPIKKSIIVQGAF